MAKGGVGKQKGNHPTDHVATLAGFYLACVSLALYFLEKVFYIAKYCIKRFPLPLPY